jgi:hypothetical protein
MPTHDSMTTHAPKIDIVAYRRGKHDSNYSGGSAFSKVVYRIHLNGRDVGAVFHNTTNLWCAYSATRCWYGYTRSSAATQMLRETQGLNGVAP